MPGCAGLWVDAVDVFGTLNIADVLEPAIELAEGGFVLSTLYTSTITSRGPAPESRFPKYIVVWCVVALLAVVTALTPER